MKTRFQIAGIVGTILLAFALLAHELSLEHVPDADMVRIILLAVSAVLALAMVAVGLAVLSACMLSSRISQAEEAAADPPLQHTGEEYAELARAHTDYSADSNHGPGPAA